MRIRTPDSQYKELTMSVRKAMGMQTMLIKQQMRLNAQQAAHMRDMMVDADSGYGGITPPAPRATSLPPTPPSPPSPVSGTTSMSSSVASLPPQQEPVMPLQVMVGNPYFPVLPGDHATHQDAYLNRNRPNSFFHPVRRAEPSAYSTRTWGGLIWNGMCAAWRSARSLFEVSPFKIQLGFGVNLFTVPVFGRGNNQQG